MKKVILLLTFSILSNTLFALDLPLGSYEGTTNSGKPCQLKISGDHDSWDDTTNYTFSFNSESVSNRFTYVSSRTEVDENGIFTAGELSDEHIYSVYTIDLEVKVDENDIPIQAQIVNKSNIIFINNIRIKRQGCFNLRKTKKH